MNTRRCEAKQPLIRTVLVVTCALLSAAASGQDAANRGVLDDTVQTLVGGNIGDGSTTATSVPLLLLRGGITRDSAGNVYFTEDNRILMLTPAGVLTAFAGSSASGYTEGTKGTGARFNTPRNLAIDAANNIYVNDSGNARIRKVAPDGTTTTIAGNGNSVTGIADIGRAALAAQLPSNIVGLAVNAGGDLFFISAQTRCVYKVTASTGILSIVAGNGSAAALASGAVAANNSLGNGVIRSLALLGDGTIIYGTSSAIRNIQADGTNAVIAGALDLNAASVNFNLPQAQSPLFPDDGSKNALQTFNTALGVPPNSINNVGGVSPGALAVDGSTIYFFDFNVSRIRSFSVGGTIQTVFGERSEGGQTTGGGFRGNNSPASTNTPRLGVVVTAGPDAILQTAAGAGDVVDASSRPSRIFASVNNVSNTTIGASDDVQVVASGGAAVDDQTPRNDDPKLASGVNAGLVVAMGVVTFVDDGNFLLRQFTVGGNVVTVAGDTVPFRIQNLGPGAGITTQAISDALPIPASNAAIFQPGQVNSDAAGNVYFDAFDASSVGNHKIYKYDAAAKTVTAIAGPALTNGFRSNGGDGGPAANAVLKGLGAQIGVLADGTLLFADTVFLGATNHTVRAVSPAGTISTIAGIPGLSGNVPPDIDRSIVNAAGTLLVTNRIGQKPNQVPFNSPLGVIGTSINDFVVADTFNVDVVVVAGGVITQEVPVTLLPAYLAQSGTNIFVAGTGSSQIDKIDLTTSPPTVTSGFINPGTTVTVAGTSTTATATITVASTAGLFVGDSLTVASGGFLVGATIQALTPTVITMSANSTAGAATNFTFQHNLGAVRGLAIGTNGLFVLGSNGVITLISNASLTTAAGVIQYTFPATLNAATGLAVSGTTVAFTDTIGGNGSIKQFTDTGSTTPLPPISTVAGSFTNVVSNGFSLQTHLSFTTFAPLAISGSNFISGDDTALQFRLITPVAPPPNSTATVLAGAGVERNGGLDSEPATNAADIGTVGGIAIDSTGALFFSDQSVNTIRRVANGTINTIAGVPGITPASVPSVVDGPALNTLFKNPAGLAFNGADATAIFVCDKGNNVIRKVSPTDGTGVVMRVAGAVGDGPGDGGDQGSALSGRLQQPVGIVFNGNGDFYIAEGGSSGSRVHVVSKAGIITQLGGGGADTPTYTPINALEVDLPMSGIAIDTGGKVYLPSGGSQGFISRIGGGNAQLVVGDPLLGGFSGDGLPGYQTLLSQPTSATFSPPLGVVFTDRGNNRVRAVVNLAEGTNAPPTAVIIANPDHLGIAPFKVSLDGSTSADNDGDIATYAWDFGDGTQGFGPHVEKVYPVMGAYPVTLTLNDSAGHVSTAELTVFSALPLLDSDTTGKGTFSIGFGKSAGNDSLSFAINNVKGLKNEAGKPFTLFIGPFSISGTVGGKVSKAPKIKPSVLDLLSAKAPKSKTTVTANIDPGKGNVSVSLKGAALAAAFGTFGVVNENTIGARTALVPVVVVVNGGDLVVGDKLQFTYKGKFNSKSSGKFAQ
jgi:hypothetical protein